MQINILVVCGCAFDRSIINNSLSDYCILNAFDGDEAMRILKGHSEIALLILDLDMPNMNGIELLKSINNDEHFWDLRTIILTNSNTLENEIEELKLGVVDYIRRPIHANSLKYRIDVYAELLNTKQTLKQQIIEQAFTFDMLFEQAPIGISISDSRSPKGSDDTFIRMNSAYEQIIGRTKKEFVKLGWSGITHPDDLERGLKNFRALQAGKIKNYSMEKRCIKPDGSVVWLNMIVAALSPVGENRYNHICLIQDISERKRMEFERKYVSEHDRLTGLYNREYLEELLLNDAKQKKFVKRALVSINLSTIESLVANYGFLYTQNLIIKTAQSLSEYCTENYLLFKAHENRFLFYILNYKDKEELVDFCDSISRVLESLFVAERIGGGIGVLEIDQKQNNADIDLLLRRLLIASERSINLFGKFFETSFYDEEFETMVNYERDTTEAITAIAADEPTNDELFLKYQPILDLKTGEIYAFEALARLNTEKLGLVPPVEFIPIAEKTKLIVALGEKIIIKAFQFINKLHESGYGKINVSINISPIELLNPGFTNRFFKLINKMNVDIRNIGIEITESVFTSDYERINDIIDKLEGAGIRTAIDDFGKGYSSLARERELKVNSLKIDKFFIDRLIDTDHNRVITSDIISMAHKLGHYVIAEGLEYKEQLQYLENNNCDRVQGYFISKPLNEDDAISFLKNQKSSYY